MRERESLQGLVLGGGPSAAFAFRAMVDFGMDPDNIRVIAPRFEVPKGSFWFHEIPDSIKDRVKLSMIWTTQVGTEYNYVIKQWGNESGSKYSSSWGKYVGERQGYRPDHVYRHLWAGANRSWAKPLSEGDVEEAASQVDFTVRTFAFGRSMATVSTPIAFCPLNDWYGTGDLRVVYNGQINDRWVRQSLGWGWEVREYPSSMHLGQVVAIEDYRGHGRREVIRVLDLMPDAEPLPNDCRYDEKLGILVVGRLALHQPGYLSHQAYQDTLTVLEREFV